MQDIQIALQVYFIGIIIATIMACLIRGLQLVLSLSAKKKEKAIEEGK